MGRNELSHNLTVQEKERFGRSGTSQRVKYVAKETMPDVALAAHSTRIDINKVEPNQTKQKQFCLLNAYYLSLCDVNFS